MDEPTTDTTGEWRWQIVAGALALGAIGAMSAAASTPDHAPAGSLWRVGLVLAACFAAVICWRAPTVPSIIAGGVALIGIRVGTMNAGDISIESATWTSAIPDVVIGLAFLASVVALLRQHHGHLDQHTMLDGFIAGCGAALVTWIVLVAPAVDTGVHPALAVASAAHLTLAAVTLTLVIDLWLDGLTSNRSVVLLVAAASCAVVGAGLRALLQANLVGIGLLPVVIALFVAAIMLLRLVVTHPSLAEVAQPRRNPTGHPYGEAVRLTPLVVSLATPLFLIALVAPVSPLDRTVRIVGSLACGLAMLGRLVMASRAIALTERRLTNRLNHDELTGLPTRAMFLTSVADSLEETWRSEQLPTVIHFSLDRFKNINDSMGHDAANRALTSIAQRLYESAVSLGGTASRITGDEFAVLHCGVAAVDEAMLIADQLAALVRHPVVIDETSVFVTASVGVAVAPRNRTIAADELMRRADIAVHRAKAQGRDRVALFDESMQAEIASRMDLEHALHGAIGRREMRLYQQPIVDISTGRLSGFEALMRWERTPDSVLPPSDFVPIAEETGIINELGSWALTQALCDLRRWIDDGVAAPTTTMSVNVSPRQLADPSFPSIVRKALDTSGVSPHLLWIEMTESMMINEPELARRTLSEVRAMGVRVALDDFGTGYSSLSLLQQFPIQRIKIDRAFISGIAERANDRSLVRTIIAMAQSMGLDLVAEGIETVHQLQSLRELGCDKAQGFLISRPVPPEAVRSTIIAIASLAELSMFQTGGDATQAPARPHQLAEVESELASHGVRPLGRPLL